MRFGIRFIEYVGDSHEVIRLAALAEAAGFDSVWFPHDTFMRNTWVLTTGTAMATSRIEIDMCRLLVMRAAWAIAPAERVGRREGRARITFLGLSRFEKGFHLIPDIVAAS